MPELPEVETCVRFLRTALRGKIIQRLKAQRPDLRVPIPSRLQYFSGSLFLKTIERWQKYLIFKTEDPAYHFAIHLGMSGTLRLITEQPPLLRKHDHYQIDFETGETLILNDPRRFGSVLLASPLIEKPNPPPCALKDITPPLLASLCQQTDRPIKSLLLDQNKLSGLGNIYACEALFLAKIPPKHPANTLSKKEIRALCFSIKMTLKKAIYYGGTSLRDFRHPDQKLGYFQNHLWVYNQEGQPCRYRPCTELITREKQAGRSTFYCKICQKVCPPIS